MKLFAGTGAIIINDISGGAVTRVGIALTFGLIVFAMIAALGNVSGAHLNPAVTLGFFLAGRFPGQTVAPYVVNQLSGAVLSSAMLLALFPQHPTLGGTMPAGSALQSPLVEILLTTILMFVILSVTTGARAKKNYSQHGNRVHYCFGRPVCRPCLRSVHEPCQVVCPGDRFMAA